MKKIIIEGGHEVIWEGDRDSVIDDGALKQSDVTVLAVPMDESIRLIDQYGETCTLLELSSVKADMKRYAGRVVSVHPLFGPASVDNKDYDTVLYIKDISKEGSEEMVKEIFKGKRIVPVTALEHDSSMAELLVAPYLLSSIAGKVRSEDKGYVTPSFVNLTKFASLLDGENPSVVRDTIRRNEFASDIMDRITSAAASIRRDIA